MKKIRLSAIKDIFEKLLEKKISREEASDWALELQNSQDLNLLEYIPSIDEEIIWSAIQFLQGVDLKDSPNTYLHNEDDIRDFKKRL